MKRDEPLDLEQIRRTVDRTEAAGRYALFPPAMLRQLVAEAAAGRAAAAGASA